MARRRIYDLTVNSAIGVAVILVALVVYLAVAVIAGTPDNPAAGDISLKTQEMPKRDQAGRTGSASIRGSSVPGR